MPHDPHQPTRAEDTGLPTPPMLAVALSYAERGWPVFPLHSTKDGRCSCGNGDCRHPGKHPRTSHGFKDATTDPAVITLRWTLSPDSNIGIRTGSRPDGAGIFVVDVDDRHDGEASLAALIAHHGPMPTTVEVRTGNGRHLYFSAPTDVVIRNKSGFVTGLDVRGDGGYVVAPPSVHHSGRTYQWAENRAPDDCQPAPAPSWLVGRIAATIPEAPSVPGGGNGAASPHRRSADARRKCLETLLRLSGTDHMDGSRRLFTCACRCVEHDLAEADAISVIRTYEQLDPFPTSWTDAQIVKRLRDAERTVERGEALRPRGKRLTVRGDKAAVDPPIVPAFQPFPVDCLPEPVASFVRECSLAIGCDPAFIAIPLLVGFASAVGNARRIRLKRGWTEPCVLWAALIAESGEMKSPALELALRAVRQRQERLMREHAEQMRQYERELEVHERHKADRKNSKECSEPLPEAPTQPRCRRCWADDVTIEALAVLLQQNPRGLLLIKDELAGLLHFDRYAKHGRGAEVSRWLEMHGGRALIVDRRASGTVCVPRAGVSVVGGIQPGPLRRALGREHRENGLAARIFMCMPPRRGKRWTDDDIDPASEAIIGRIFEGLYELESARDEYGEECPVVLGLTPAAKTVWVRYYDAHAAEQTNLTGDLAASWSKLYGGAARLALVLHCVRQIANDPRNPPLLDPNAIDQHSMKAAIRLAQWFAHEARRLFAVLQETESHTQQRQLVELIQRRGGVVSVREWQRVRNHSSAAAAEAELELIVENGSARWEPSEPGGRGGRPSKRLVLNPPARAADPADEGGGGDAPDDQGDPSRDDEDGTTETDP